MNDDERKAVGTCYKQHGQQAAITLGQRLVSGSVREARLAQWLDFCRQHPQGFLYCMRGGLRSHITQQWLKEDGQDYPLITGGYKALRNFLISINQQLAEQPMHIVGGNTGSGKTLLIRELPFGVDLEGAARHRGSSFGRTVAGQDTQINFENVLAIDVLKKQHAGMNRWVLEDEGRTIGSNHVPIEIFEAMQKARIVVIDDPFDVRLARLKEEYVDAMCRGFIQRDGEEEGWQNFSSYLHQGMFAIRKRLGLERHQSLSNELNSALELHRRGGGSDGHERWLVPLLREYYDPMYIYQLGRKAERIIFRGDYAAVRDYLLCDNS